MPTEGWLHELGVLVYNITVLIGSVMGAYYAIKAAIAAKSVEKKTDDQTKTLIRIDKKADDAVTAAVAVDKKTDEQAKKLDVIADTTESTKQQTNGHLSKMQEQHEALSTQYISALESREEKLLDALREKQHAEAAAGGRRKDDRRESV